MEAAAAANEAKAAMPDEVSVPVRELSKAAKEAGIDVAEALPSLTTDDGMATVKYSELRAAFAGTKGEARIVAALPSPVPGVRVGGINADNAMLNAVLAELMKRTKASANALVAERALRQLQAAAANAPVAARNPEGWAQLVSHVAEAAKAPRGVFVDAADLRRIAQTHGISDEQIQREMPETFAQMGEAESTRGTVEIPVSEMHAPMYWENSAQQALIDAARVSPEEPSIGEAKAHIETLAAQVDDALARLESSVDRTGLVSDAQRSAVKEVKDRITARFRNIGRFSRAVVENYARFEALTFGVFAARLADGTTALDLYTMMPNGIHGELRQGVAITDLFAQPDPANTVRIMFEVAPDPHDLLLTARWAQLDDQAKTAISQDIANLMSNALLKRFGLSGALRLHPGGYLGVTNPSFSLAISDPAMANQIAAELGAALRQDSVLVLSPTEFPGAEEGEKVVVAAGSADLAAGRALYDNLLYNAVRNDAGEQALGGHFMDADGRMHFYNKPDWSGVPLGGELAKRIGDALAASGKTEAVVTEKVWGRLLMSSDYGMTQPDLPALASRLLSDAMDASSTRRSKYDQLAYHGTAATFDAIDLTHIGTGVGTGLAGFGFYLSTSRREAEMFAAEAARRQASDTPKTVGGEPYDPLNWRHVLAAIKLQNPGKTIRELGAIAELRAAALSGRIRYALHRAAVQGRTDAEGWFDPKAVDQVRWAGKPGAMSREILVNMRIDDFLRMAKYGEDDAKQVGILEHAIKGEPFESVPFLTFENNGESGQVTGHEGRHRAMFLRSLGYTHMPVILRSTPGGASAIRWGQQTDPSRYDYIAELPTKLIGEDALEMDFPVTREMLNARAAFESSATTISKAETHYAALALAAARAKTARKLPEADAPTGIVHTYEIPDDISYAVNGWCRWEQHNYLLWDAPLSEQPHLQLVLPFMLPDTATGAQAYAKLAELRGSEQRASEYLARNHIFGAKFSLDEGTGYVVYDPAVVKRIDDNVGTATILPGTPATVEVPGVGTVNVTPNEKARSAAAQYMADRGLQYAPPKAYAKVDEARARRIADAYEAMQHAPNDPEVQAAYAALADEIIAQYLYVVRQGLDVDFIEPGMDDPYAESPRMAVLDINSNNHMWVFLTDAGYGQQGITPQDEAENPMLRMTRFTVKGRQLRVNDLFRIVHDYFGHAKDGFGFRAEGEENAWQSHAAMFSPLARRALTVETRGQNSWLNYGPHGETNRGAKTADTVFAPQKIGLLPAWVSEEGALFGPRSGTALPKGVRNGAFFRVSGTEVVRTADLRTAKVTTPEEAATAFSHLTRGAQEVVLALVTDPDGRVVGALRHSLGGVSSAGVEASKLLGWALSVKDGHALWFGHNHPGGSAELSDADRRVHRMLNTLLSGSRLRYEGLLAVAHSGKGTFQAINGTGGLITGDTPAGEEGHLHDIHERTLEQAPALESISSAPAAMRVVARENYAEGLLLLDSQNKIAGHLPVDLATSNVTLTNGLADELLRGIEAANATSIIVVRTNQDTHAKNLAEFIKALGADVYLTDVISRLPDGSWESSAEKGLRFAGTTGAYYQQENHPIWASELRARLADLPVSKDGTADIIQVWQWLDSMASSGKIRKAEIDFLGLKDWLQQVSAIAAPSEGVRAGSPQHLEEQGVTTWSVNPEVWNDLDIHGLQVRATTDKKGKPKTELVPGRNTRVSREAIDNFIAQNTADLREVIRGEPDEAARDRAREQAEQELYDSYREMFANDYHEYGEVNGRPQPYVVVSEIFDNSAEGEEGDYEIEVDGDWWSLAYRHIHGDDGKLAPGTAAIAGIFDPQDRTLDDLWVVPSGTQEGDNFDGASVLRGEVRRLVNDAISDAAQAAVDDNYSDVTERIDEILAEEGHGMAEPKFGGWFPRFARGDGYRELTLHLDTQNNYYTGSHWNDTSEDENNVAHTRLGEVRVAIEQPLPEGLLADMATLKDLMKASMKAAMRHAIANEAAKKLFETAPRTAEGFITTETAQAVHEQTGLDATMAEAKAASKAMQDAMDAVAQLHPDRTDLAIASRRVKKAAIDELLAETMRKLESGELGSVEFSELSRLRQALEDAAQSSDFEPQNLSRFSVRPALYIGEIQSDPAQDYRGLLEAKEAHAQGELSDYELGRVDNSDDPGFEQYKRMNPYLLDTEMWVQLVLRRAIKYAVDSGYRTVVLGNGEDNVNSYSLEQYVSRLVITQSEVDPSRYKLIAFDRGGNEMHGLQTNLLYKMGIRQDSMPRFAIEKVIGKERTDLLIAKYEEAVARAEAEGARVFRGTEELLFHYFRDPRTGVLIALHDLVETSVRDAGLPSDGAAVSLVWALAVQQIAMARGQNVKLYTMDTVNTAVAKRLGSAATAEDLKSALIFPRIQINGQWTFAAPSFSGLTAPVQFATGHSGHQVIDFSRGLDEVADPVHGWYAVADRMGLSADRDKIARAALDASQAVLDEEARLGPVDVRQKVKAEMTDFTVKGEGMREFYDKIVPSALRKVLSRMSPQAAKTLRMIPLGTSSLGSRYGFDVTPDLADLKGPLPYFQDRQGSFDPNTFDINLLAKANFSTYLHELGHKFLELLTRLVLSGKAPQQMKDDLDIVLRWGGVPGGSAEERLAAWAGMTIAQRSELHEKWAESWEQKMMSGRSPSLEMQPLMDTFSAWMKAVYKTLQNFLTSRYRASLTQEVEEVMDRMIATDGQIEAAKAARGMLPLFGSAEEAGATQAEWRKFLEGLLSADNRAASFVLGRSLGDMNLLRSMQRRKETEVMRRVKGLREEARLDAAKELDAEPVYRAIRYLKTGELTDSNGQSIDAAPMPTQTGRATWRLDKEAVATLLPDGEKLPSTYTLGGAADPELVAPLFGYPSGRALVDAIRQAMPYRKALEAATDKLMLERHGDVASPEAVARAVDQAIHSDAHAAMLATEMMWLDRAQGNKPRLLAAIKARAKRMVEQKKLADLKPTKLAAEAAKHGDATVKALQKRKDPEARQKALEARRAQLFFHWATQYAYSAQDEVNTALREFKAIFGKDEKLAKYRDMNLVNVARALLAQYGLSSGTQAATDWLEKVREYDPVSYADLKAMIDALPQPPRVQANRAKGSRPYQEFTVAEFRAVRDAIISAWTMSRRVKQIEVGGKSYEMGEVIDQLLARMADEPRRVPANGTTTESDKLAMMLLGARAALRRVGSWADARDGGGEPLFSKFIWRTIREKVDAYMDARIAPITQLVDILRSAGDLNPKAIAAPELGTAEEPFVFNSGMNGVLHALLHTGNESNMQKLLRGYGWGDYLPDGSLDTSKWDAFVARMAKEGKLTKDHMDAVQQVWDLLESLKPELQRVHKELYGYYFEEVKRRPLATPWGTYAGGYAPALADSFQSASAAEHEELDILGQQQNGALIPAAPRGFTKERTGVARPLLLDIASLPQHMDKVLRFIHLQPAIRDVLRILNNRAFKSALHAVDPAARKDMLIPWLQRVARNSAETPSSGFGGQMLDRIARFLRVNTGLQTMFANVVNTLQQITGFSVALAKVPAGALARGVWSYARHPKESSQFIAEKSVYMRNLESTQGMEVVSQLERLLAQPTKTESVRQFVQRHGYFLQSAVQATVNKPVWLAAYETQLAKTGDEQAAIFHADEAVRHTQGSFSPVDISRAEGGSPLIRMFLMFYGYFNMLGNLMATEGGKAIRAARRDNPGSAELAILTKSAPRLAYVYFTVAAIPAVLSLLLVRAMDGQPWDKDGDGSVLDDMMGLFLGSQVSTLVSMVPYGSLTYSGLVNGFDHNPLNDTLQVSPVESTLASALRAPSDVAHVVAGDKELGKKDITDVMTALGFVTGLPLKAVAKPLGYTWSVEEGHTEPKNAADALRGLATGK